MYSSLFLCVASLHSVRVCVHVRAQDREERAIKTAHQPSSLIASITATTSTSATTTITNTITTTTTNNTNTTNNSNNYTSTNNTIANINNTPSSTTHVKSGVSPQESIQEEPEPESMLKKIIALKTKEPSGVHQKVTECFPFLIRIVP